MRPIGREDLEKLIATSKQIPYAKFVSSIFDLYGQRQGKRLVGDKTPGYVRHIPLLHALWPKARFVHLIRDGRDVCLSMLNWKRAHKSGGRLGIYLRSSATLAVPSPCHLRPWSTRPGCVACLIGIRSRSIAKVRRGGAKTSGKAKNGTTRLKKQIKSGWRI